MSDTTITDLLKQAPFSFIGTIEHLGAATMSNIPIDERTAVVHVVHVLHAPPAFTTLDGQRITVQLAVGTDPPAVGDTFAFFAQGVAFGDSIVVAEVGRLPVDAVMGQVNATAAAGGSSAFDSLQSEVDKQATKEHADSADAIVVGRVIRLGRAFGAVPSEHDPDWWKATIDVFHVEKGDVAPGEVDVLYANSIDVRWRLAPKPKASQGGLWLLHATTGELHAVAPFLLLHPEDFQPTQELDALRGNGA
ncbi:MAG: hypothetical protein JWL77_6212 [Chthonomonadaceae bacterium]|nr:hypothetical protein [Chthonomonadaceae bacterium]